MTATHTFTLPTGIVCEVKEFTGKEQEILTATNKKTHTEKLNELLKSIIVRVGSNNKIDDNFLDQMLECDKRFILVEARQFSMDFEPDFVFVYKYTDSNGKKAEFELREKIKDGHFPMFPMQLMNPAYDPDTENEDVPQFIPANYEDYSEVDRHYYTKLPKSGMMVRLSHLDGKGNAILQAVDKDKRTSSTIIQMRNPVYFEQGSGDNKVPIQLNLSKLSFKDIEHLRSVIKKMEGRVDTEIMFEHPEADSKPAGEKEVIMDVLGTVAFFFPSGAI